MAGVKRPQDPWPSLSERTEKERGSSRRYLIDHQILTPPTVTSEETYQPLNPAIVDQVSIERETALNGRAVAVGGLSTELFKVDDHIFYARTFCLLESWPLIVPHHKPDVVMGQIQLSQKFAF